MIYKYAIIVVIYSQASALYCPLRTAVCATDGKTYPTVCHLKLVASEVADLQVLHDGPCYLTIDKNDGYHENNDKFERTDEKKNDTEHTNRKENVNIILKIDKNNLRIRLRGCEECWTKCSREFDNFHIMLAGDCVRCCFNELQTQKPEAASSIQPLMFPSKSKQRLKRTKYKQKTSFFTN